MQRLKWLAETAALLLVAFPIAVLPASVAVRTGGCLGSLAASLWKSRFRIAVDNIRKSIDAGVLKTSRTPDEIARESFRNFGRSLLEILKIYSGTGRSIIGSVEIRGEEHMEKALKEGAGVIVITGHCGNWELMALVFGLRFRNVSVVARKQNNPYLNLLLEKARSRYGNKVIYKQGALKSILTELKKNAIIGILMDQAVIREEGFLLPFLGRPAWTLKIPALIGRKTRASLVPVFIHRTGRGGRHVITIHPEVAISDGDTSESTLIADTERLSSQVENHIRDHPEEWLWIHRRWKRAEEQSNA